MKLSMRTLWDGALMEKPFDGKFDLECEVCVIGLGTAGAISAIAAAKRGHSVIGVDLAPIPGGVGTAACVWDYYYGAWGGLYEDVNVLANRIVGTGRYHHSTTMERGAKKGYTTPVKELALSLTFEQYGVRSMYSAAVTDVIMDGDRVCGAVIFDGEKKISIGARVVVDGAEGAVCRLAGAKMLGGRRSDNREARFSRTVGVMSNGKMLGRWTFCEDFGNRSPEEAAKLVYKWSASEPCLPKKVTQASRLYALGFETGRRECQCVECETVYPFSDFLAGKKPSEPIFYTLSPLDNANPDLWNEDEEFQDWQVLCTMHAYGPTVGIPAGALIPKGFDGLLAAGKHIGTGHVMTSTVRMRTDIEKCGEAAGVMASLCVEHDCSALDVSSTHINELRRALAYTGCLSEMNNRGLCDLNDEVGPTWQTVPLPADTEELKTLLSSIHPCVGLYAVRIGAVPGAAEALAGWLTSEDRLLSENAAVGLGLLGDRRCLPVLREILERPMENYVYHSGKRYRYPWLWTTELCNVHKALCLIGRFADEASRARLEAIAADPSCLALGETLASNESAAAVCREKAQNWAKAALAKLG